MLDHEILELLDTIPLCYPIIRDNACQNRAGTLMIIAKTLRQHLSREITIPSVTLETYQKFILSCLCLTHQGGLSDNKLASIDPIRSIPGLLLEEKVPSSKVQKIKLILKLKAFVAKFSISLLKEHCQTRLSSDF